MLNDAERMMNLKQESREYALEPRLLRIILLSRLRVHGRVLYERLKKRYDVVWVGWRVPYALNFLNGPFLLLYEFLCLAYLHRTRPRDRTSIIFVHFISFDALIAVLFKKLCGYKIIIYAVGSDVLGIGSAVQQKFLKWVVSKADKVLCVNRAIEKRIRKLGNYDAVVLPTPFLEPSVKEYHGGKEYDVVSVGALTAVKRHSLLIRSCKYLSRNITVAIVGEGSCKNYLKNLASEYQDHRILFLGNIPHEKVWVELQKAKVYVHTSLREGVPSSIFEAIWCNLPVIAVKASYIDDLTSLYGFKVVIVEKCSPYSLAIAIENVLQNYEIFQQMASLNKKLLKRFAEKWDYKLERIIHYGMLGCRKTIEEQLNMKSSVLKLVKVHDESV